METLLIQVNNEKARQLLRDLEDLSLIKVIETSGQPKANLSDKYAGKLPADVAEKLHNHVSEGRKDWNVRTS